MKTKTLSVILLTILSIFSAWSPVPAAIPTEEIPAPVLDGEGYEALQIDDVQVDVGVGSPIPVHVNVSGSGAVFNLDTGNTATHLQTTDSATIQDDIKVDAVNIEVGMGSPIPVKAIISSSLPNSCTQLGEIRLHRDGNTFFVRLIADVSQGDNCQADSIPFRLEVPLNVVNLPEGTYEVNVNGATASFDARTTPANP